MFSIIIIIIIIIIILIVVMVDCCSCSCCVWVSCHNAWCVQQPKWLSAAIYSRDWGVVVGEVVLKESVSDFSGGVIGVGIIIIVGIAVVAANVVLVVVDQHQIHD